MDTMEQMLGEPTKIVIDGTGYLFSPITMAGWLDCQDKIKECERQRTKERVRDLKEALEVVPVDDGERRVLLQDILNGKGDDDESLPSEVVTFIFHKSLLKEQAGITLEKAKELMERMDLSEVLKVLGLGDTSDTDSDTSDVGSKPSSGGDGG